MDKLHKRHDRHQYDAITKQCYLTAITVRSHSCKKEKLRIKAKVKIQMRFDGLRSLTRNFTELSISCFSCCLVELLWIMHILMHSNFIGLANHISEFKLIRMFPAYICHFFFHCFSLSSTKSSLVLRNLRLQKKNKK